MEAFNERWEEFKAKDLEGRIAVYLATLEDKELMDDEMAFEMLNVLHDELAKANQRDRFPLLVKALRDRLPEVYKKSAHYYLSWLISDALVLGQLAKVPSRARALARTAGRDIDTFNRTLEQLEYHGQLATLVEIMPIAWARVKKSRNVVPWGVTEFAERAAGYEIFAYLEKTPSPDPRDPVLLERLRLYLDNVDLDYLEIFLTYISGRASRVWTIADFTIRPEKQHSRRQKGGGDEEEAPDPGRRNLAYLTAEFLGHMHREEKVSFTRGNQGKKGILNYLNQRLDGELEPKKSLWESGKRSRKRTPLNVTRDLSHLLCPDHGTLDRFLAGYLGFLNFQYYPAAATMEMVPAWLRFLKTRGLIDAEQQNRTFEALSDLKNQLIKIFENFKEDPSLREGLKSWGLEAPQSPPAEVGNP
jgi:hypothetical protein